MIGIYLKRGPPANGVCLPTSRRSSACSAGWIRHHRPARLGAENIARRDPRARIVIGVEGSHLSHAIFSMADDGAFLKAQPPDRFAMPYKEFADRLGHRFGLWSATRRTTASRSTSTTFCASLTGCQTTSANRDGTRSSCRALRQAAARGAAGAHPEAPQRRRRVCQAWPGPGNDLALSTIGRDRTWIMSRCCRERGRPDSSRAQRRRLGQAAVDSGRRARLSLAAEAATARLCHRIGVPLVFTSEYSPRTERQIIDAEVPNLPRRWRRKLWAA